jgi:hypothetical protein
VADTLPCDLLVEGPDGQTQPILKRGASLPGEARCVFATQKAGERGLSLRLHEGAGKATKLVGVAACELPPGLPANTWLAVFVRVSAELSLSVEVTENLRRLRLRAAIDATGARSKRFVI